MAQRTGRIAHEGTLDLNGIMIPCFVLDDGTRVLSGRGFQEALRIRDRPEEGEKRGGYILPKFFTSKAFKPLVESKLGLANFEPILCSKGNKRYHGYEATVLADICDAVLEARKQGVKMTERQQIVADQCEILIRSLAKVGVIALVDEATGYQYVRERDELQKILKAYVAEELLPWQKTFPDVFYREIFRLNGWDYTVNGIQKRPGVIGRWTNRLIYEQLPNGVLEELKRKTPKSKSGNYTARLFQSLTTDHGNPHLQSQLNSTITLMQVNETWVTFESQFDRLVARRNGQLDIDFGATSKKPKPVPVTEFDKGLKGLLSVPPPPREPKPKQPKKKKSE